MGRLNDIKAPLKQQLKEFDKIFKSQMKSKVPLLDKITRYIIKSKGKQMRPLFVFLSAGLCGKIEDRSYRAASLIELLHTATLVHDDVVDESYKRRGFFSLNALWRNKIAVLVGDYLLSRGLLMAIKNNDHDLLKIVSEAVEQMSEGELLQIEKARKLDIREDIYFEIIRKKTASLIASCCATGAASVGSDEETIEKFRKMGENIGIAFQIKDDLFDYEQNINSEKPNAIDIKERKMTLPLIYLLQKSSWIERRKLIYTIKNHNTNPAKVADIIRKVKDCGGLDYAEQKMNEYRKEAFEFINEFPDNEYKTSMINLIQYTTERKK
jgi:octaprenyl-diphosphate synthase